MTKYEIKKIIFETLVANLSISDETCNGIAELLYEKLMPHLAPSKCWKCNHWPAINIHYSEPGLKLHCRGCMKTCERCTCR